MFRNLIAGSGLAPAGEQIFTESGSFVVPVAVREISVVLVGGGESGGDNNISDGGDGGHLTYATIPVTPGETLDVVVGAGGVGSTSPSGAQSPGGTSSLSRGPTELLSAPGGGSGDTASIDGAAIVSATHAGGTGGPDGARGGGGGGAGGYSGRGGNGGFVSTAPTDGAGGAGGGGEHSNAGGTPYKGGNGGGVGLLGEGASGAGAADGDLGEDGDAGSGGNRNLYGGGGGGGQKFFQLSGRDGGAGAVRIVWPGRLRRFPSTNVGAT